MNLNNTSDFNSILKAAVGLGILHVSVNTKRVKAKALFSLLANTYGDLSYRRFHVEILNRAYGLAFINAAKMQLAARLDKGASATPKPA